MSDGEAGVVFFDFTDTFGSVDRSELLYKLGMNFYIKGKLFLHLHYFLSNRFARMKVGDKKGKWIESDIGTSAGTILGSILFIIHIHDASQSASPKFADDLHSLAVAKDDCHSTAVEKITREL